MAGIDVPRTVTRKDVRVDQNPELAKQFAAQTQGQVVSPQLMLLAQDEPRARIRKSLVEADKSDINGFERIIGLSDLLSINFLARGMKAARAVCRIRVPGQDGGWYGSGFMVGPGLLATNNHVLGSRDDASQAEAEFGYEHDAEGVLHEPVQFNLAPHEVFFTDIEHDITLVGVVPFSEAGVPLERYGFLPLLPLSGKGMHGEWVTLIQHPGGQPKQIAIRASQIVELDKKHFGGNFLERFIHYSTDTEPGSSGAPVLNDQWQVVAIHHKAVPKPGKRRTNAGKDPAGEAQAWLANEGVRVSAITTLLERKRFSDKDAATAVDRLERAIGMASGLPTTPVNRPLLDPELEKDPGPHSVEKWSAWNKKHKLGYDPDFLSIRLDLLDIIGDDKKKAAPLKNSTKVLLDYLHFSVIVHKDRKFPLITAVNVRGDKLIHPGEREGRFRIDSRMDEVFQPAARFYEKKLGEDMVQFSRGHLVRRFDPCWGETKAQAQVADDNTFHYTNAAPQVQKFNAGEWLDIEDYVLNRIQLKEKKMTIFSGPIFRKSDPEYGESRTGGPWQIPVTFWKIAVIEKEPGKLAATAFIRGQTKFVKALFEARVFTNLRQNTQAELHSENIQTTIAAVEEETGLDFSPLREFDSLQALESTRHARFIRSPRDIII